MSRRKRSGNKEIFKVYKKVRNTSSMGAISVYILMIVFFAFLIVFIAGYVMQYIIETKLSEEYRELKNIARMYEAGSDDKSIMDYIEAGDSQFVVKDADGKIVYRKGDITYINPGGKVFVTNKQESYIIYEDSALGLIYPSDEEKIWMRWKKFFEWLKYCDKSEDNKYISFEEPDWIKKHDIDWEKNIITILPCIEDMKLPVWVSLDINNGTEKFIGRAYIVYNIRDKILAAELMIGMLIISSLVSVVLLVYLIRSAVNLRRVFRIFYSDPITKGHNWIWFVRNADDKLRKWINRKKSFVVIDLVFHNYRNYCLCHSIDEGEEILARINKTLSGEIVRGEMCAHASMSNFALLLNYQNDELLRKRLLDIIDKLRAIDSEHNFEFQAGADLILPMYNHGGKIIRRRKYSIENAFNNACSARGALGDTDETGIRIFDQKLLDEQRWRDTVCEHQWSALKNEEFKVYYQPKYDPRSNVLKGAEALIRWESPEFGFVTPGRIIPIFEKNGFITEIDHYMISHVAKDQKAWLDAGYDCVPVSVNVSRAHFGENDLAEQIRDMVDETGCPHDLIELELTESAFFDDKNAMIRTIKKLKKYGFSVSMDDFGAGYSSLNSLKDMPLDILKLDADFFRGENAGERGRIVVSEAIKLAKSLEMRTVAEGIEEKDQVDFLAELGCDMIQGYYFAKPMPKTDYSDKMVKAHKELAEV